MSRRSRLLPVAVALTGWVGIAVAQDDDADDADEPDLGFLEYLGSWQESDEEWLLVVELEDEIESKGETQKVAAQAAEDPVKQADETDEN
jgi:hypothetical protein